MRIIIIMITASLIALAGCVTMPDPVPDNYLSEKTAEQAKNLEKMENAVIAKNHEVQTFKDKVESAEQKYNVEKGRLGILQDEKKLLDEKQKQFQLENDSEKIGENAKLIADKDIEIKSQVDRVEYSSAFRDHVKAQKEVADAELSVLVAEMNFERARIAREYLVKRQVEGGGDKKDSSSAGADKYDEKYKAYLDKQREVLSAKKISREEAAVKVKIAEDKLKK
jgi:hypothetical protein